MHLAKMELINGHLVEVEHRDLSQASIRACPHYIFDMHHYREDGTCKCNDPKEEVMRTWGYKWSAKKQLWV